MPSADQQNMIIAALPEEDRFEIVRHMEPVDLPLRTELVRGGRENGAVYFLTAGLTSIVATMSDGSAVECAAAGHEGWIGAQLFSELLPAGSVAFQQIAGSALRMSGASFENALRERPSFAAAARRYRGLLLSCAMQTAACNRVHDATARCARWLLFTSERTGETELAITHEFVAQMLGGSRAAVTATLTKLEIRGLISRSRGKVILRDVDALRDVACECRAVLSDAYARYVETLAAN